MVGTTRKLAAICEIIAAVGRVQVQVQVLGQGQL